MKVKILLSLPKTIDGKPLGPFTQGQELEMDGAQAALFIGSAMAEEVLPPVVAIEDDPVTWVVVGEVADIAGDEDL